MSKKIKIINVNLQDLNVKNESCLKSLIQIVISFELDDKKHDLLYQTSETYDYAVSSKLSVCKDELFDIFAKEFDDEDTVLEFAAEIAKTADIQTLYNRYLSNFIDIYNKPLDYYNFMDANSTTNEIKIIF